MIEHLGLYLFVTFVNCATPGAGVLYTLSNAFRYGKSCWWLSPTGNAFGVLVMSIIAACGLGAIIRANEAVFSIIQITGCFVMFWLGWRSWNAPSLNLADAETASKFGDGTKKTVFWSAARLQTTNPMLIVFVLSLLPQFVSSDGSYALQMTILIGLFVFICWAVHMVYSRTAVVAGQVFHGTRFSWWLNHISGSLFWLIGLMVLWDLYQRLSIEGIL